MFHARYRNVHHWICVMGQECFLACFLLPNILCFFPPKFYFNQGLELSYVTLSDLAQDWAEITKCSLLSSSAPHSRYRPRSFLSNLAFLAYRLYVAVRMLAVAMGLAIIPCTRAGVSPHGMWFGEATGMGIDESGR